LRLVRADAGISRAQAFSAGLLPDPQLGLSRERQMGSPPDASVAFTAGLTFDMSALITRPVTRLAAAKEVQKTDLTCSGRSCRSSRKARMLFIKQTTQDRTFAALDKTRALFQDRLDRTRTAAQRGLLANDS